jgi:hypothetical protein
MKPYDRGTSRPDLVCTQYVDGDIARNPHRFAGVSNQYASFAVE